MYPSTRVKNGKLLTNRSGLILGGALKALKPCTLCKKGFTMEDMREHRKVCLAQNAAHLLSQQVTNAYCDYCHRALICFPSYFQEAFHCTSCDEDRVTSNFNLVKCFVCNIDHCSDCIQRKRYLAWLESGAPGLFDAHLRFRPFQAEPQQQPRPEESASRGQRVADAASAPPPSYEEVIMMPMKEKPALD